MTDATLQLIAARDDAAVARIARLAGTTWREHYPQIIGIDQTEYMLARFQTAETIRKQIADGAEYFLAVTGGADAGYFSYVQTGSEVFLSKLYVLASQRGRGVGRRCLEFVWQETAATRVWLTVNKQNAGSIAFYQKHGFTIVDEVVTDIGGGFVMDDYVMERQRG